MSGSASGSLTLPAGAAEEDAAGAGVAEDAAVPTVFADSEAFSFALLLLALLGFLAEVAVLEDFFFFVGEVPGFSFFFATELILHCAVFERALLLSLLCALCALLLFELGI